PDNYEGPADTFRVADTGGPDDLNDETRSDQVGRRALDVPVEVNPETPREVIDRDLTPFVDPLVQRVSVVDQDFGDLDVEVTGPVRPVGEPALRLLRQAIDEDQRGGASIGMEPFQVKQFADVFVNRLRKLPGAN